MLPFFLTLLFPSHSHFLPEIFSCLCNVAYGILHRTTRACHARSNPKKTRTYFCEYTNTRLQPSHSQFFVSHPLKFISIRALFVHDSLRPAHDQHHTESKPTRPRRDDGTILWTSSARGILPAEARYITNRHNTGLSYSSSPGVTTTSAPLHMAITAVASNAAFTCRRSLS